MRAGKLHAYRALKATLLLLLFIFALGAQAVHQIETPAKPAKECGAIDVHFHQDLPDHNCDLCDYKDTAEEVYAYDYSIQPLPIEFFRTNFKRAVGEPYFLPTNKGPPTRSLKS